MLNRLTNAEKRQKNTNKEERETDDEINVNKRSEEREIQTETCFEDGRCLAE